jgi:hypothetical protein
MSKKLLFNGCSMTAGDAITWDKHNPDIDWWENLYLNKPHADYNMDQLRVLLNNYTENLRSHDNLSGQVGKLTGLEVKDISLDGNSNQNICISTISFLSELTLEERKNYHVFVGWTSLARKVCWNAEFSQFSNLNTHHLDASNYTYFSNYIKEVLINGTDMDHTLEYFHNVIALQSYLKANGVTYTFCNTMIEIPSTVLDILSKPIFNKVNPFKHELLFDKKDWISFEKDDFPWIENYWKSYIIKPVHTISEVNTHPNLETVIKFSKTVAAQIAISI